jgi:ADP-ribose pyrophosphatase YjhB (NUDIX family)
MPHTYDYARPALTVDCVVFGLDEEDLKVALVQRGLEPFAGKWALPGGFVHVDESLEDAARRELQEEAGLAKVFLEQLYTFGDVKRDPRERIVTVAYYALVNIRDHRVQAATDARNADGDPLCLVEQLGLLLSSIPRAGRRGIVRRNSRPADQQGADDRGIFLPPFAGAAVHLSRFGDALLCKLPAHDVLEPLATA